MALILPELPYNRKALEPHISERTLEFHHGKHHAAYVTNGNKLIEGTPLEKADIETIIKESHADATKVGVFNNAAQVWNHTFYWQSMKPGGGGAPTGAIAAKIDSDLGGFEKFKEAFKAAATTQFGSGWAWLVLDGGRLKIEKTPNAELPLTRGQKAILTCDVWEHAYYLDFQNRRPDYVDTFLNHLVNWDFANKNLGG